MNLHQKQKDGNVISINADYAENTCKTQVLFKRINN